MVPFLVATVLKLAYTINSDIPLSLKVRDNTTTLKQLRKFIRSQQHEKFLDQNFTVSNYEENRGARGVDAI